MGDLLKGGDAVYLFVLLFLPGFISVKVYGELVATHRPDFSKDFFTAVSYSMLNFAFFLPFLLWFRTLLLGSFPALLAASYLVLLIAPAFWPWLYVQACTKRWLPFLNQAIQEKPWDYFFAKRQPVWVVATLTDGRKLGGFYAGDSYASAFPNDEQLYIQQQWLLGEDDEFIKPIEQSAGFLVDASKLKSLEFYEFIE
jgi:hypothetical protein